SLTGQWRRCVIGLDRYCLRHAVSLPRVAGNPSSGQGLGPRAIRTTRSRRRSSLVVREATLAGPALFFALFTGLSTPDRALSGSTATRPATGAPSRSAAPDWCPRRSG